jgi:hypothetical protein
MKNSFWKTIVLLSLVLLSLDCYAQMALPSKKSSPIAISNKNPFSPLLDRNQFFGTSSFIENIGQYNQTAPTSMGKVLYGFDGFESPVVFTKKGVTYCFVKTEITDEKEIKRELAKGEPLAEVMREHTKKTKQVVNMAWIGANPNVEVVVEDKISFYNTYGKLTGKASGYSKMTYKELYPNIDVVFFFPEDKEGGFEYNIIARPGADVSKVQFNFEGDVNDIQLDKLGNLVVKTKGGNGFMQHTPVSYQGESAHEIQGRIKDRKSSMPIVESGFNLKGKNVSFALPKGHDKSKTLVVDPWITGLTTLATNQKGLIVDYDYDGNLYVYGGTGPFKVAKYNLTGTLLWTFNGTNGTWLSDAGNGYAGDIVVDKVSGKVYIGQGFNGAPGAQAIRIKTDGTYDNFISTVGAGFYEMWELIFVCNGATTELYAGGGTTANNTNFAKINTTTGAITMTNTTGLAGISHDIVCGVIDPSDKSLYSVYASVSTAGVNNKIIKNTSPYNNVPSWNVATGFTTFTESTNNSTALGNGQNALAVNANYLFYYDGKNLKAFNKSTGAAVGTALAITGYTIKTNSGIVADACNNIYLGGLGVVKVLNFNGLTFDDSPTDITLTGAGLGKNTYDVKFDESNKQLYVSGNGFVAKYDAPVTCAVLGALAYSTTPCISSTGTITVTLTTIPTSSTFHYILRNSSGTLLQESGTSIAATSYDFAGLTAGSYKIEVRANEACAGPSVTTSYTFSAASIGGNTAYLGGVFCSPTNSGTINLTGQTGSVIKWQTSTNGGTTWTDIANTTTSYSFTNALNNQQYRAVVNNGASCLDAFSSVTTITVSAPSVGGTTSYSGGILCGATNSGTINLSGQTGSVTKWQTSIDGGTVWTDIANTTTTYNFSNAINNQQYKAVINNGGASCLTANSSVVTINVTAPSVGGTTSYSGGAFCSATNSGTINLAGQTGSIVKWQTSTNGGTTWMDIANTTTSYSFTDAVNSQQYRAVVNNGGSCLDANSSIVTISVSTPAVGGTTSYSGGTLCSITNNGIINLSGQTGSIIKWQTSMDGGSTWTDIANTTAAYNFTNVVNNQQYRVVINNGGGCSDAFSSVTTLSTSIAICVEICGDGIDNDGNGLIDCDDLACKATASPLIKRD